MSSCHGLQKDNIELQSYATGVLASAMTDSETESQWHEQNSQLVPSMIDRLKELLDKEDRSASKPSGTLGKWNGFSIVTYCKTY